MENTAKKINVKLNNKIYAFSMSENTENLQIAKNAKSSIEKLNELLKKFADNAIDYCEKQSEKAVADETICRQLAKCFEVVEHYGKLIKIKIAKDFTENGKKAQFFYVLRSRFTQQLGIKGAVHDKKTKGEREIERREEIKREAREEIKNMPLEELELLIAAKKREIAEAEKIKKVDEELLREREEFERSMAEKREKRLREIREQETKKEETKKEETKRKKK